MSATWPGGNNLASPNWNRLNGTFVIGSWIGGYDGLAYDPVLHPLSMDNNGHFINFVPACQDVAEVGAEVAALAVIAAAAGNQQLSWVSVLAGYVYLGNNSFSVTGNQTALLQVNRAIVASTSSGSITSPTYLHVKSATYGTVTTVVTYETTLPSSGILSIWLGQDVNNDPYASTMTGATSSVVGTGGAVPAPATAQENSILCGDAVFHDPATLLQIWS